MMKPTRFRCDGYCVSVVYRTDATFNRFPLDFAVDMGLNYYCNHGPTRTWIVVRIIKNVTVLLARFPLCCAAHYRRMDWARSAFFLWLDERLIELSNQDSIDGVECWSRLRRVLTDVLGEPSDDGIKEVLADLGRRDAARIRSESQTKLEFERVRQFLERMQHKQLKSDLTADKLNQTILSAMRDLGFGSEQELCIDELKRRFRSMSLRTHPDRLGSVAAFQQLQRSYEMLIEFINTRN